MKSGENRPAVGHQRKTDTGVVFNIQRYSLHDGPGIRTVVFLKGCPLHCAWCCNPESIDGEPHLTFNPDKCLGDGRCVQACPTGARTGEGLDPSRCTLCGRCADACPSEALEILGRTMSIPEILEEVEKDRTFYESSGGGVTLSGGEVLAQWRFGVKLLLELRDRHLHTAVETTGYGPWERVRAVAEACDLVLYDLKHMDEEEHRRHTGVSNRLILENARRLAGLGCGLIIRIPLIGGINTDDKNIRETASFAAELGVDEIHLLPYHRLGESKYRKLGREYDCEAYTPDERTVQELQRLLETRGFEVKIGG